MLDIHSIASQVKYNCNISDARFWGLYSPCGALLRLRDLFRFEKGLSPWDRIPHAGISKWIEDRENLWNRLGSGEFRKIEISGKKYRPFDVKGINTVLMKSGLVYGAGCGNLSKPLFFLARRLKKIRKRRYVVYVLGEELARGLSTAPAMLQGNTIIVRYETMRLFLWGKLEEMRSRKHEGALYRAFMEYGLPGKQKTAPQKLEQLLDSITREEVDTYIHHELGEASQRMALGKWWKELVSSLPYSRAELFIRGLKDVLSDTCDAGMLPYIIKNKKAGSLAFYTALLGGFRGHIFRDMKAAYDDFTRSRDWAVIESARKQGYKKAKACIKTLRQIADTGNISPEIIEKELISKVI